MLPYLISFIQKHLICRFKCSFSSSFVHLLLPFSLYLPRLVIKGNWQVFFSLSSGTLNDFQKEGSFPDDSVAKNPPTNAEDAGDSGSKTWVGMIPKGGYGNPLQYSWLENSMDRGAWQPTVHEIVKSQTQLRD